MFRLVPAPIALAAACTVFIAGCGNDGEADASSTGNVAVQNPVEAVVAGQVFKGPTAGASVCVFAVTGGSKGLQLTAATGSAPAIANGCVLTAADGSYSFVLPAGTQGDLLVESSGGTYCSDETVLNGTSCAGGGTPVSIGANVLSTLVTAPSSGTVNAPLTLLTTAAVRATPSLGRTPFAASYGTIAASFNAPAEPSTAPSTGALTTALKDLATYVGTSTGDLQEILTGIAAGTLTAANTNFPVGIELVAGADQALARLYKVGPDGATLVSSTALPGIPGTYTRSGTTVTVNMPLHAIRNGLSIPLQFAAGTGGTATSGIYKVTVVDADNFMVTDTASGTITAGTLTRDPVTQLTGTYSQVSGATNVTVTLPNHALQVSDTVDLRFIDAGGPTIISRVATVIDENTIEVELGAAATSSASGNVELKFGTNYSAFDTTMHPSGKWLYVSSGYDCWRGYPFCWGGDLITTFRIDWQRGKLTFVGSTRTGGTQQEAIPVKLAFNPAGTQMVHQDHNTNSLVLWNVNSETGAITRVSDSGAYTTRRHGAVFSGNGQYVYNGAKVFTVTDSTITKTNAAGFDGNGGEIVGDVLFFTDPRGSKGVSSGLRAYSLSTPTAPALLASIGSLDRDVSTRNGTTVVASGFGGIKSYNFTGTAFVATTPAAGSGELQRDGTGTLEAGQATMYRTVHLNAAGTMAVSSYFTSPTDGTEQRGGPPSGYLFATVGTDGKLTRIADVPVAQYARVAKFIKQK